MPHMHTST